jgi:hypothetical protein
MDIKIEGLDALLLKLGRIEKVETVLRPWAERTLTEAQKNTDYTQGSPPRRAGQSYIRTFTLMGGWRNNIRISSGSITAQRYNNRTPYGPFVMGRGNQTGTFAGRWPTDAGIEKRIESKVVEDLARTIQTELNK